MILLTGATGNVGSKLLAELIARKVEVRALVRKPADVERMRKQGIDAVAGDMTDRASVRAALEGIDRLYLLSPSNERLAEIEGELVDEAKRAGVQHIVKQSVLGAAVDAICPFTQVHASAEEAIKASGIPYTFLHLNNFMQNFVPSHAWSIRSQDTFFEPLADARVSHVDTRDVALAAANILTQPAHEGKIYDITGPEALSDAQIADRLSSILGRPIHYVPISDEQWLQGLLNAAHLPHWYANSLVKLYQFYRQGGGAPVTPDLEQLIEQKPRTMDAYLQDHRTAFTEQ